jgi:hypothetical protein
VKKEREKMYSRKERVKEEGKTCEGERERTCEGKGKFLKKYFLYGC